MEVHKALTRDNLCNIIWRILKQSRIAMVMLRIPGGTIGGRILGLLLLNVTLDWLVTSHTIRHRRLILYLHMHRHPRTHMPTMYRRYPPTLQRNLHALLPRGPHNLLIQVILYYTLRLNSSLTRSQHVGIVHRHRGSLLSRLLLVLFSVLACTIACTYTTNLTEEPDPVLFAQRLVDLCEVIVILATVLGLFAELSLTDVEPRNSE